MSEHVNVKGKGKVTLTKNDYVAQGGEGKVWSKHGVGYKLYTDPRKMIPLGKIQELEAIQDARVIRPLDVVDKKGIPVGFTFRFVEDAWTLCQLFPRVFRDRHGLTFKTIVDLVRQYQEGVENVHKADVLIVDGNEMNFLVAKDFSDIFFIDTDSYQTKSFPATALMESVRDRHMQKGKFSTGTDWFAFAVVTYQLFCGIHPYKGKHKTLKGFDARMNANVSVFDPSVRVPKAVYPPTVIPDAYRAWYEAVLQNGKRCPPPGVVGVVAVVMPQIRMIQGTDKLSITELHEFDGTIADIWTSHGHLAALTDKSLWCDGRRVMDAPAEFGGVAFSPRMDIPVAVGMNPGTPTLTNMADRQAVEFGQNAQKAVSYDGRVYFKAGGKVLQLSLAETGRKVHASAKVVTDVMPNATKLFDGCLVQDLLGTAYVNVFPGSGSSFQFRLKELEAYQRIVEAKFDSGVLMVVVRSKGGKYDRLVFRFSPDYQTHDLRKVEDISPVGLNFVVLDSGVAICLNEDEQLEMFSARKDSPKLDYVEDPMLGADMKLAKQGNKVLFARGNKVFQMKMK